MLNLSVLLEDSARRYPDRVAVVLGARRLTYAEVDAAANRVAGLLVDRGIRPGDRVALSCPNLPWFPILYYGILKAGAVVVPLNVLLKAREVAYHLNDSGAVAYFCFEGTAELAVGAEGRGGFDAAPGCAHFFLITADPEAAPDGTETLDTALAGRPAVFDAVGTAESDPAVILYTSGTTGQAKGAVLSHSNLVLNAYACGRALEAVPLVDTHLVVLPLFHSFGMTVQMNLGFATASTIVLVPRFDPAVVLRLLEAERVTLFAGVPTMYWSLLNVELGDVDVRRIAGRIRKAVVAGSTLPIEIINGVRERFGVTIIEGYGLSEASPAVTLSPPGVEPRPGSIGKPLWGTEVKLVAPDGKTVEAADEIGEIAVRGPNVMLGYLDRPAETAEAVRDGWLHTGDLGKRDEDGWWYIVDRVKDMIIRGGFNVYPREIELVLAGHPDVSLAAVIGVPHPSHGEEIKAFVIRKPGTTVTEPELIAWSREQMAAYKYPRLVTFVDELPLTPTGKPLKRNLR